MTAVVVVVAVNGQTYKGFVQNRGHFPSEDGGGSGGGSSGDEETK